MSEVRRIPLDLIKVDPAIQQRVNGTSEEVVKEYAQAMRDGDRFPPVVVFTNNEVAYHLADGFHRIAAYRSAQSDGQEMECEVHLGDHDDALLFACGANASHGLSRTNADKRKVVLLLLQSEKWSRWGDREIARKCKVSPPFVAKFRDGHLKTFSDTGPTEKDQAEGKPATPNASETDTADADADRQRIVARGGKQFPMKTALIGAGRPMVSNPTPKKTSADRDTARLASMDQVKLYIKEICKLLSACDPSDREMIRNSNQPYLDGWFDAHGKFCFKLTTSTDGSPVEGAKFEPRDEENRGDGLCQAGA